eukprot:augustus_masked-scaffold_6-processed-gene-2.41-mRNA-1 protein AED:1.00 eAED:1.00 QI:0/-1/0/0/-1/1/1/0/1300
MRKDFAKNEENNICALQKGDVDTQDKQSTLEVFKDDIYKETELQKCDESTESQKSSFSVGEQTSAIKGPLKSTDFSETEEDNIEDRKDYYDQIYKVGLEKDLTTDVPGEGASDHISFFAPKATKSCAAEDMPSYIRNRNFGNKKVSVHRSVVFHFSPEKCFSLVTKYLNLLSFLLKPNQDAARKFGLTNFNSCPRWVKGTETENKLTRHGPGSRCRFSFFLEGCVVEVTNEIRVCSDEKDKTTGKRVYRFATSVIDSETKPLNIIQGHETLMVFTSYEGRENKCHLYFEKRETEITNLSFLNRDVQKQRLNVMIGKQLVALRQALTRKFCPKLPKRDTRVAIIGAGPSGLHMAHLLLEKGLNKENLTIYEQSDMVGGKSKTIPYTEHDKFGTDQVDQNQKSRSYIRFLNSPSYHSNGSLIYGKRSKQDLLVGGKELFHDLGTANISSTYFTVRKFLRELQEKSDFNDENLTEEVPADSYAMLGGNIKEGTAKDFTTFVFDVVQQSSALASWYDKFPLLAKIGIPLELHFAIRRYIILQKKLMGSWTYTLCGRRSRQDMEMLVMPFEEFLHKHNLHKLHGVFTFAVSSLGYGVMTEVPTLWGMTWITPEQLENFTIWRTLFDASRDGNWFITGLLQFLSVPYARLGRDIYSWKAETKSMLVSGWQQVWERVVKVHDLDPQNVLKKWKKSNEVEDESVTKPQNGKYLKGRKQVLRVNAKVKEITKKGDKIIVSFEDVTKGGNSQSENMNIVSEEHDYLILAVPLFDAYCNDETSNINLSFWDQQTGYLKRDNFEAARFVTRVATPEKNGDFSNVHLRVLVDSLREYDNNIGLEPGKGDVYSIKDTYKALQPKLSTPNGHRTDPARDIPRDRIFYQYASPGTNLKSSDFDEKFYKYLDKYGTDLGSSTTVKEGKKLESTYFTRFKIESLLKNNLWNLLDIQGEKGTLYVHSSSHFESILHLMNYNKMLLAGLTGQLSNFSTPKDDLTIEEYHRINNFVFNPLTYAPLRPIVKLYSAILTILWALLFILIYPILEYVVFRKQRSEALEKMHCVSIPARIELDLKQYVKSIPLLHEYKLYKDSNVSYVIKKENYGHLRNRGFGAAVSFHEALEPARDELRERNPSIQLDSANCFLQYSYADYKELYRKYCEIRNAANDVSLHPVGLKFAETLEEMAPYLLSYMFTWVLSAQIYFYAGWSYRFEDYKGGGLRVPKCGFLEAAVKEVGVVAGRRVCILACKLPREQKGGPLKSKVSFRPDHVTGKSGYGCSIRFYEGKANAYADHELFLARKNVEEAQYAKYEKFDW